MYVRRGSISQTAAHAVSQGGGTDTQESADTERVCAMPRCWRRCSGSRPKAAVASSNQGVPFCKKLACSLTVRVWTGFLPHMQIGSTIYSKLPVSVNVRVNSCRVMNWRPVRVLPRLAPQSHLGSAPSFSRPVENNWATDWLLLAAAWRVVPAIRPYCIYINNLYMDLSKW